MPANDRALFKAQGAQPAPQYYNPVTDRYEVIEGSYGANSFIQLGTVAMESWTGNSNITKTFPSDRYGFSAINDGTADLSFTINGQTRMIKPGEGYAALFEPFTSVSISATSAYRAEVLR